MVLVDTSVLIGFFKGQTNQEIKLFEEILRHKIPFGIPCYAYQEVLQGTANEKEYNQLKEFLSTQVIYFLPETKETYEKAAKLYFDLRRMGVTVRSTIDILIALMAIESQIPLLHSDKDFDNIASI